MGKECTKSKRFTFRVRFGIYNEPVWENKILCGFRKLNIFFFFWFDFSFNIDPTKRYTFWSAFVGGAFLHLSVFGANQLQIQRYMTVQSVKEARK